MSRAMGKRVRIGKHAVPALLLVALLVGTVAAAAYVILTWTMTLTVGDYPRVHFYNPTTLVEANTMDIALNIFPNVVTIEEDAGWDIRSDTAGNIYIRVSAMDTVEVAEVKIKAYDGATTLFEQTWTASTTTWSAGYLTAATTDYDLWIEVTGAAGATGPTTTITVEIKVENP